MNKNKIIRKMGIILCIVFGLVLVATIFLRQPRFGRLPKGERLERIKSSPNYRDGKFQNRIPTTLMTSGKGRLRTMSEFVFQSKKGLRPDSPIPAVKTDLSAINRNEDMLVWFGHSSCLLQVDGRRILVDPVFRTAAPLAFLNRPFNGTDIYRPEDIPDIDYLIITHDHWDHLDYYTVKELKDRTGKVICPLGVGEHFEYWGFASDRLVELDWDERATLDPDFTIDCLPARHFSGRGLISNKTLWASFLLQTPSQRIYFGGDTGYDRHFTETGRKFPDIDLAIIENGQYNDNWRNIHTMPQQLSQAVHDLGAKKILTVHHSRYALSRHSWYEPLENARKLAAQDSLNVLIPKIGEVIYLK